ncbi:hypothetical protein Scep_016928 [Stephania cephalantha]|uniref:Uncharacterized protein n=1 Tax=Stephania cephalantha TaxID=152367 RepID=A0AAP0IP45_9MAGN
MSGSSSGTVARTSSVARCDATRRTGGMNHQWRRLWERRRAARPQQQRMVALTAISAPGGGAAVTEDGGEEKQLQWRRWRVAATAAAAARGTTWSNGAVARYRADRFPTRQQQWTRRRDFDEARRRDGFE